MTALKHVFDPNASPSQAQKSGRDRYVHAWQDAAPATLCDLMKTYWEYGSKRQMRVMETDDPVNCLACGKSLEVLGRKQLAFLSPQGLEKVLDLVAAMRNGDLRE